MIRYLLVGLALSYSFLVLGQTAVTISKKNSNYKRTIDLEELKASYNIVKTNSLNISSAEDFIQNYIKYKIAVNEAYHNSSVVQSPRVESMIVNPIVKENFNQILYKYVVDQATRPQINKLIDNSSKLSNSTLKRLYLKNPYYQFQYIIIRSPNSKKAMKTQRKRAFNIYRKVKNSNKKFPELIKLYSDNSELGYGLVYHLKSNLHSAIPKKLDRLSPGDISSPIQTSFGFLIVKMFEKVPFQKIGGEVVRQQHFDVARSKIINSYFKKVKSKYNININQKLIRSIRF